MLVFPLARGTGQAETGRPPSFQPPHGARPYPRPGPPPGRRLTLAVATYLTSSADLSSGTAPPAPGLFRESVLGRASLLSEVFAHLRGSPWRHGAAVPGRPDAFTSFVPVHGPGNGDEAWELMSLDGAVYVVLTDCTYAQDRIEMVRSEGYVELHYTLTGSGRAGQVPVNSLDLVLCCLGPQASYAVHCDRGRRRSVAIFLRRETFNRYLDPHATFTQAVQRELAGIGEQDIYLRRIPVDFGHAQLARTLLDNPYRDGRRILFAEAKVAELVCMSLDLWSANDGAQPSSMALSPRDMRLLHTARQLIAEELELAPTIAELARRVGINTSKLKAGFRLLFGCTIFEYTTRVRMERGLALLRAGDASVAEVAALVGYQHAPSFSAAFQRFYGCAPRQARQRP